MEFNPYQTPIEDLGLPNLPTEVVEEFYDYITNVPYIQALVAKDRKRACDLERDESGRIIVDVTHPHILENMEYFTESAQNFKRYGRYTNLRPNFNPNSEYGKWIAREVDRIYNGMVRPSDGEWIPGDLYFFWNYCNMEVNVQVSKKKYVRNNDFPAIWDGHYLMYHYKEQARNDGQHGGVLASRRRGKSYTLAEMLLKLFIFGESLEANHNKQAYVLSYSEEYLNKGGILNKFQSYLNFIAKNTEFPSMTLKKSWADLHWILGYYDLDSGLDAGLQNEVMGVATASSIDKVRGKRGSLVGIEEFGSFPNLLNLYQIMLPSVQASEEVIYGQLWLQGTAGSKESDFASAQELMYNPRGYNLHAVDNVYDKLGQGKKEFIYFFPAYLCREGFIGASGNSDVTASLISILKERYRIKYNASDPNALVVAIAEDPITPSEAILKTKGALFPVTQLSERLNQIDADPAFYDDVYCGSLAMKTDGTVEYQATNDLPIREFPLRDNKAKGCIEFYAMPEKKNGKVMQDRYIGGIDPVDNDQSGTLSLVSCFILDLWTDTIVCEYTGRLDFADDCYEVIRRMLIFYNATALYENNLKGIYSYFLKMNCLHLLADTPKYLQDKLIIKTIGIGNTSKGVHATVGVNNYADTLIRDWLLRPFPCVTKKKNDLGEVEMTETTMPNLYRLMGRALIKELIADDGIINVDRVRALGMLMLYREAMMVALGGDVHRDTAEENDLANDPFFTTNYDDRFKQKPVFPFNEVTSSEK